MVTILNFHHFDQTNYTMHPPDIIQKSLPLSSSHFQDSLADVILEEVEDPMANSAPDDLLVDEDVDLNEESFVIKSKPKKIKIDSRLLSGFSLEAAVPLEEGRNVDTKGIIVGKRVGRNILMTHIIIPNQDTECFNVASWVLSEFKPWGNSTDVIGIIYQ